MLMRTDSNMAKRGSEVQKKGRKTCVADESGEQQGLLRGGGESHQRSWTCFWTLIFKEGKKGENTQ
jgi:hypothetical protein